MTLISEQPLGKAKAPVPGPAPSLLPPGSRRGGTRDPAGSGVRRAGRPLSRGGAGWGAPQRECGSRRCPGTDPNACNLSRSPGHSAGARVRRLQFRKLPVPGDCSTVLGQGPGPTRSSLSLAGRASCLSFPHLERGC